MSYIPTISARQLIKTLKQLGFAHTRTRGSHYRFEHPDGRKTVVPVHKGRDIPKGLLHQIVAFDIGMDLDEFTSLL